MFLNYCRDRRAMSTETDDEDKVATFETGWSLGVNRKGCL